MKAKYKDIYVACGAGSMQLSAVRLSHRVDCVNAGSAKLSACIVAKHRLVELLLNVNQF